MSLKKESKNPVFICLIAIILGIALGVWGWNKGECNSSPDCYVGGGFLKIVGIALIVVGLAGWALLSNKPKGRS